MIAPDFLADLRRKYRTGFVLNLVQLEQLAPGWWPNLTELADEMGASAEILSRNIKKMDSFGLIGATIVLGRGGAWIWWIKKHENDKIDYSHAPYWTLNDVKRRSNVNIPKGKEKEWAERYKIPHSTLRSLLSGQTKILGDRWVLVKGPVETDQIPQEVNGGSTV